MPLPTIWSDAYLAQLETDAEQDINKRLGQVIYHRFYLSVTQGVSVVTMPSFVRGIQRITFLGWKLEEVNWDELVWLTPATVFVGPGSSGNVETSQSRPYWYAMHPTNPWDVRLYPTPSVTLLTNGPDPYSPSVNEPYCTVSCWRSIDTTSTDPTALLPPYIDRRTRKAFVLWKAFEAEGKGQNLKASAYYKGKYEFLIDRFNSINSSCYLSKKYSIDDGLLTLDQFRYPRPILPSNFERIIF